MTISGFLPQRWRPTPEIGRHAEAVAGVLHTPPLQRTAGGPGIVSLLGTVEVLPYLVAIKSLRGRLRRGGVTIVDDGTLTGEDRAILAHHCGDPEILPHQAVRRGAFPAGGEWAALLTILDRRAGQYWIALDPHTVTLGELPEAESAIASNRSFTLIGDDASGGAARQAERRLAVLCGTRGWRYRPDCHGLVGFAAGGAGRALAAALCSELATLDEPATAATARNLVLANEVDPVLLAKPHYRRGSTTDAAFAHFPDGPHHGDAYAAASREAIAQLLV
jgi:hypothetical protein